MGGLHPPQEFCCRLLLSPTQQMQCSVLANVLQCVFSGLQCSIANKVQSAQSNAVQLLVFTSFCCQQRLLPIANQYNYCTEVKRNLLKITEDPCSALQCSTIKPWQAQVQCSQQRVFPDVLLEDKLGQFGISIWDELNHFKGKKLFSFSLHFCQELFAL